MPRRSSIAPLSDRRAWFVAAAVAVGCTIGAEASWRWFGASALGNVFYPPAGVTIAALVLLARPYWPWALGGAAVAELAVSVLNGMAPGWAAVYLGANLAEVTVSGLVLLAALGVARGAPIATALDLGSRRGLAHYVAAAVVLGPLVGALLGGTAKWAQTGDPWAPAVLGWWAGDGLAVLAIGAPLIVWLGPLRRERPGSSREYGLLVAAMAVASALGFLTWQVPPSVAIIPVLMWAAFRLGIQGVALTVPLVAVFANASLVADVGLLSTIEAPGQVKVGIAQLFVAVVVVAAWSAAILVAEQQDLLHRHGVVAQAARMQRLAAALAGAASTDDVQEVVERSAPELGARSCTVVHDGHPPGAAGGPSARSDATDVVVPLTSSGGAPDTLVARFDVAPRDHDVAAVRAAAVLVQHTLDRVHTTELATERDGRTIDALQRAVLPDLPPAVAGVSVASAYRSGGPRPDRIGGDWFAVVPLSGGRLGIAVGDVVGHGIEAVAAMAEYRYTLRTLALSGAEPHTVLAQLEELRQPLHRGPGLFSTCVYGVIDPAAGSFTFSNAGHPPPLVVPGGEGGGRTGRVVTSRHGPPIGAVAEHAPYESMSVPIGPGDLLVLYTDGVVERPGEVIDEGIARLARRASTLRLVDRESCDSLITDLVGATARDDAAVVLARVDATG